MKWDGRYIAGIDKVSALKRSTEVVSHREGGDPNAVRKSPGLTKYEPIVLERGVTHDAEFERWANKPWNLGSTAEQETSLEDFRKDIVLEIYNESGQLASACVVYRCWVSQYVAIADLDANQSGVAMQSITIEHEGWERDDSVDEPTETSNGLISRMTRQG